MKTVYRAFFADSGCSLITIVSNRVEKHSLSQTDQDELRPSKLWTAKIKHCVNVVEASQANRLVATDTNGRHFGLCSKTGDILWQSASIGEGDPGLIVKYQSKLSWSQEVFVFATWSGVLQRLDPTSGKEIEKPTDFLSQFRGLQLTSDPQRLFVTCLVPAKSDSDPVGETLNLLDLKTNKIREVVSNTFSRGINVSPTGRKALFVYLADGASGLISDRSERWEIKDIETGSTLCERTFAPKEFFSPNAVWSPNGQFVATSNKVGHLVFSADTLETVVSVEGQQAERPVFHPSGTHICLCRANDTKIVPMHMLKT
ncbi:MAG: TolB family protein [Yoonia sp.]|uniref:TolB family protein n=1 Tax=Yoonia sp. TaxID=2212373 RepID=UPI003EF4BE67